VAIKKSKLYDKQNIGLLFSWSEKNIYKLPHMHMLLMKKLQQNSAKNT